MLCSNGELVFFCGVMGSGKTESLLEQVEVFEHFEFFVYTVVSATGSKSIESRNGSSLECVIAFNELVELEMACVMTEDKLCNVVEEAFIFVDEAQFLSKEQVRFLRELAYKSNKKIQCYGLLTDFKGEFFEGSLELLRLSDSIIKLDKKCEVCDNHKAIYNMRKTSEEELVVLDKNKYMAVCQKCFKEN